MTRALAPELADLGPVKGELLSNDHTGIVVCGTGSDFADLIGWGNTYRDSLLTALHIHGAVMLQGFPADLGLFNEFVQVIGGDPLPYTERSTPRSSVSGNIYTSTEYPPDQAIPMHNENSYSDVWPDNLYFFCQVAAETGGATPVADSRAVCQLIPSAVRDRFAGGVIYARTFRQGLGLSWQEAFQTEDRSVVEAYCASHHQQFEWIGDDLRTRHHRPATAHEPFGGEEVWFNQANLFHVSSLEPDLREVLLSLYGEDFLPRNAYFADGSPISADDLAAIAAAYDKASFALPWSAGDIMVVSNMLAAHGRQPYTGQRRTLVAMT